MLSVTINTSIGKRVSPISVAFFAEVPISPTLRYASHFVYHVDTPWSDLREQWKKKKLARWKKECDAKTAIYEPTNKEKLKYPPTMRLTGEKRTGCKKRRTALLAIAKNMRMGIEQY